MEVAAGRVGYWLQITGCVHRNLRAKQSVPRSSISTLQHEAILLHSCFQCHSIEGSWPRAVKQRAILCTISYMSAFPNYFDSSASDNRPGQTIQRVRKCFNSNSNSNVYVYGSFHTFISTKCLTLCANKEKKVYMHRDPEKHIESHTHMHIMVKKPASEYLGVPGGS